MELRIIFFVHNENISMFLEKLIVNNKEELSFFIASFANRIILYVSYQIIAW